MFTRNTIYRPRLFALVLTGLAATVLAGCTGGRLPLPGEVAQAPAPPPPDPRVLTAFADNPLITLTLAEPECGEIRPRRRQRLCYVRGGNLVSIRSRSREPVSALIDQAGGVGGLNGTFFSDARVAGTGNKMIGPLRTADGLYAPADPVDVPRCLGRPLVILGEKSLAIVPFDTWMGDTEEALRLLVPDARDAFLAGGWLVHHGIASTEEQIRADCVADAMDFRRRAFMGVDMQGRLVLGATDYSIDSARLALSLEKLDIQEAVLLDSGFSTSLVWRGRILVSGHSRRSMPSRPVPHALIVLPPVASLSEML